MIKCLGLLLVVFSYFTTYSQDFIFKEFGFNDGLPSSQVYDMFQDKYGIIWFGTDRGLSSYNGYEFINFGIKEGILNNVILDFYPQVNGRVYCNTLDNNLFYFNDSMSGFVAYKYNNLLNEKLNNHHISSVYEDEYGNIHITDNLMDGKLIITKKGLIKENPRNRTSLPKQKNIIIQTRQNKQPLFYYTFSSIEKSKSKVKFSTEKYADINVISLNDNKSIVIKDNRGVYVFNSEGILKVKIENEFRPLIIEPIDEKCFFIGYLFGGGKIVDVDGNVIDNLLSGKSITRLLVDSEGGYWFSTLYSGVFYVKEPKVKRHTNEMGDVSVKSLTKNTKNELFVGYENGLVAKIGSTNEFSFEYKSTNKTRAFIEYIEQIDELLIYSGSVYLGKDKKTSLNPFGYITKLSEPFQNKIIVSHIGSFVIVDRTLKENKIVHTKSRVHDACFWKDMIYYSMPSGAYTYKNGVTTSLGKKNSLFYNRIDDIDYNEARNEIYFATLGAGVIVYDKNKDKVYTITQKDGLLSDIINEIYVENKNEIWVCTNAGLNKILLKKNGKFSITGLKSSSGLLNDGINDVEVINDVVWVASVKGLVFFTKSLFEQPQKNKNSYNLRIKDVKVNDRSISLIKLKDLSYKDNRIEFLVEGISFKKSDELIYKYKLVGLDDKWYFTKNRKIFYSALPHGDYIFKISVTFPGNFEKLQFIEIPISVKPPFWKHSWFVLFCVFAFVCLLYFFFKVRLLTYNKDISRELLRLIVRKLKRNENFLVFREGGKDIRIRSNSILYVKSAGNYIDIITESKTFIVRAKIGEFILSTPDPIEYARIHRSFIVRIDKVDVKSNSEVKVKGISLPVSKGYESEMKKLIF